MDFSHAGFIVRFCADCDFLNQFNTHLARKFPHVDILLDSLNKLVHVRFVLLRFG